VGGVFGNTGALGNDEANYAADSLIVDATAVKARRPCFCACTCAVLETGLRLVVIKPVERM
jgi:arginyl-tRNA synthetase